MTTIRFERLANGLFRAFDYTSKTSGLYNPDGTYRSGDFRLPASFVICEIRKLTDQAEL